MSARITSTDHPAAPLTTAALSCLDGVRHGFFTREGGVSGGIYASLNCGFGSNDVADDVAANRARAAAAVGLPYRSLVTAYQVHSPGVVTVERAWQPERAPRADAMVTRSPGIALGILAADCAPVLLADRAAGVVGAAHAGWRGALTGVIDATVDGMVRLGADVARIVAAIGPCIAPDSYEVGAEFRERFMAAAVENEPFFQAGERAGHYRFDLPGFVRARLAAAGVATIARVDRDTYADEALFSYRRATHRSERDYGRNLSVIALAPPG